MLNHIAYIVAQDADVKDIQRVEVVKEGEFLHVEVVVEVDPTQTVAYVDDVRDRLMHIILKQKGVQDVMISFDEDDGVRTWTQTNQPSTSQSIQIQATKMKNVTQEKFSYVTFFYLYNEARRIDSTSSFT